MKGTICGIKRMEIHDGDGLRTTVFFKGCPLSCVWCHNPESISFQKQVGFFKEKCIECGLCKNEKNEETAKACPVGALVSYGEEVDADALFDTVMKDAPFFKSGKGGVTFSGGECLAQADFAVSLAEKFYKAGVSVYIDTCGFVKQTVLERIIPFTDKFLYDVKAFSEDVHKKCTGQTNEIILENLKFLSRKGCKIEIRYPLVKGFNDGECEKIGAFLCNLKGIEKVKILKYHRFAASRYDALGMNNTLPDIETTYEDIEKAVEILRNYGLNAINGASED